jgi:hypothetical protein
MRDLVPNNWKLAGGKSAWHWRHSMTACQEFKQ